LSRAHSAKGGTMAYRPVPMVSDGYYSYT